MDLTKTVQSLTSAENMRNQTKLIMQPFANWEKYLTPAPLSIAILGDLVFISSKTDFSINKNPPKDGYKYIRYPEYIQACLMQVCNFGWSAFNKTHKSMDQIRLHTSQVPDYIKTAMMILFQGDDEVIKAHLPGQLSNITLIADECLELATLTEQRFINVITFIQELLEACVNTENFYEKEMDAIKKTIEENKLREKSAKETMGRTMKAVEFLQTLVQFFQMVSTIVKSSLSKTLRNFVTTSTTAKDLSYNAKLFSKDLLYIQAFKACDIASLVNMIAETYREVFSIYLIDIVNSLIHLISMDKNKPEFESGFQNLQHSCDTAQKEILKLVQKNKEEYEKKTLARQQQIDQELLAILPAPPEETKIIQEAVQTGFTEKEEESYY